MVDLTDMSPTATLSYAGNTNFGKLTINDGSHKSVITFVGNFTSANFAAPVTDGHGGSLIAYRAS
jgi:hypothetical protein